MEFAGFFFVVVVAVVFVFLLLFYDIYKGQGGLTQPCSWVKIQHVLSKLLAVVRTEIEIA